jgi:methionyl-tRNA synthetase
VRYFLLREVPFGNDGDFSHRAMVNRMNGELANDLGNLAQRSLSMINKNCGGKVPEPQAFSEADRELLDAAEATLGRFRDAVDRQAFHEGLEGVWQVVRAANAYVDRQAPWALRKSDPPRMNTVLYVLADVLRRLGLVLQPVMPGAMARLLDQLGVPDADRSFAAFDGPLAAGTALPKPEGIFPRFDDAQEGAQEGVA